MAFSDLMVLTDRAIRNHLGGVPVVYQPAVGGPVTVVGMFDENYVLAEAGEAGVEQIAPAVWLKIAELPAHPNVDEPTLTIGGTAYRVRERQYDGLGGVRLLLHRAL